METEEAHAELDVVIRKMDDWNNDDLPKNNVKIVEAEEDENYGRFQ